MIIPERVVPCLLSAFTVILGLDRRQIIEEEDGYSCCIKETDAFYGDGEVNRAEGGIGGGVSQTERVKFWNDKLILQVEEEKMLGDDGMLAPLSPVNESMMHG